MLNIGIDIGTTKIAGVLIRTPENKIIKIISQDSNADIKSLKQYEKLQNTDIIINKAMNIIQNLKTITEEPIASIGISCQMHGFLYITPSGDSLSPLYTWLDSRASQPLRNLHESTAIDLIFKNTGCSIYSGYALATHYYNHLMNDCPPPPYKIVSIGGYLTMKLCKNIRPCIDPSEAAGFGLYNYNKQIFLHQEICNLFDNDSFLPCCVPFYYRAGQDKDSIPVFQSLGDNQASFMGTMKDHESHALISLGTSGQISVLHESQPKSLCGIEVRPYPKKNLIVGSSLTGGKSFELLVDFFIDVLSFFGISISKNEVYEIINKRKFEIPNNPLEIIPFFNGTRNNPNLRGSIKNINLDNFTTYNLIYGVAEAVVSELKNLFENNGIDKQTNLKTIIGSGNGIRKNPKIQQIIKNQFSCKLILSDMQEEAACGAAFYACEGFKKTKEK